MNRIFGVGLGLVLGMGCLLADEDGFEPLFNGRDLSGWKIPVGDNGHWKVVDPHSLHDDSHSRCKEVGFLR